MGCPQTEYNEANTLFLYFPFKVKLFFFGLFIYSYVSKVSRLTGIDQAIHKLNVGHYTLDVKVSQLIDRISRLDGNILNIDKVIPVMLHKLLLRFTLMVIILSIIAKVGDLEDSIQEVYQHSKDNRKEIGRLEGKLNLFQASLKLKYGDG